MQAALLAVAAACGKSDGRPFAAGSLGHRPCEDYYECGVGRFCHPLSGACFAECSTSADCVFFGEGLLCNRFGQCLVSAGNLSCASHADCPAGHFCNGRCSRPDPAGDPLPTRQEFENNPADPRIYDQDGDGKPGMTVYVDGVIRGRLYNIQRWSAEHHGHIVDSDHIRGLTLAGSQEVLLGTSNSVLDQQTTTSIHLQADRTYFRLMRVAEDASCSDLIRLAHRQEHWLRHTGHLQDVADP